jgi:hypothetical protein
MRVPFVARTERRNAGTPAPDYAALHPSYTHRYRKIAEIAL